MSGNTRRERELCCIIEMGEGSQAVMFIELEPKFLADYADLFKLGTPQISIVIMPSKLGLAVLGAGIFAREDHFLLVLV